MCYIPPKISLKIPKASVRYMYLVEESLMSVCPVLECVCGAAFPSGMRGSRSKASEMQGYKPEVRGRDTKALYLTFLSIFCVLQPSISLSLFLYSFFSLVSFVSLFLSLFLSLSLSI